jgi:hypothetical protein
MKAIRRCITRGMLLYVLLQNIFATVYSLCVNAYDIICRPAVVLPQFSDGTDGLRNLRLTANPLKSIHGQLTRSGPPA